MDFFDSFEDLFPEGALDNVLAESEGDEARGEGEENRRIWSVSELLFHINTIFDMEFGTVWLEGEVGQVSLPPSGHCYFSLKDEKGCIKSVCFRSNQVTSARHIKEGAKILCLARLNVYQARGTLQAVVEHVEPWGEGLLRIEFERLKRRLADQGLFDDSCKKEIPSWPKKIFVITSPAGAAIRDFLKTARAKFPPARIILVPSLVQGDDAPNRLIDAIDIAEESAGPEDVIVLTRGGGSIEDLWAFNSERLARRIFDCKVPVVSAIGHEVDFTICDFVADKRAATPTAAAELVCPSRVELRDRLQRQVTMLAAATNHALLRASHRLNLLRSGVRHPYGRVIEQRLRLDDMQRRLISSVTELSSRKTRLFSNLFARLKAVSPESAVGMKKGRVHQLYYRIKGLMLSKIHAERTRLLTVLSCLEREDPKGCLKKGFAVVLDQQTGRIVTQADQVTIGHFVTVILANGQLECQVRSKKEG